MTAKDSAPFVTPAGRILHVSPWFGSNRGGVEVAVQALVQTQRAMGIDARGLTFEGAHSWPTAATDALGSPLHKVKWYPRPVGRSGMRKYLSYRLGLIALGGVLHSLRPIAGIAFHYLDMAYPAAAGLARKLKIPYSVEFCGSDLLELEQQIDRYLPMISAASAVVTVSRTLGQAVDDVLESNGLSRRTRTIYRGVPDGLTATPHLTFGMRSGLLFVGNLKPVKGPDQFINVIRALRTARCDEPAEIIGDGSGLDNVLGAPPPNMVIRGRLPREEVHNAMRRSKVLLLTSRNEGLPGVALEAQALGLPVVAFDVGGTSEAVIDGVTGFILPSGDVNGMARKAVELLSDAQLWSKFSVEGRNRAATFFSAKESARAAVEVLINSQP